MCDNDTTKPHVSQEKIIGALQSIRETNDPAAQKYLESVADSRTTTAPPNRHKLKDWWAKFTPAERSAIQKEQKAAAAKAAREQHKVNPHISRLVEDLVAVEARALDQTLGTLTYANQARQRHPDYVRTCIAIVE
jgi:hypothetical protein